MSVAGAGEEAGGEVARVAGAYSSECAVQGEVDEGVKESKESNPEPLGHNVAPGARPEVDDVPGV